MIIGISGKKGSGKDLVGSMIQHIISRPKSEHNFESFQAFLKCSKECKQYLSKVEIIKYADTLKDIVCLLTGCTRLDLESEEFKQSKLPEHWRVWKVFNRDPDCYVESLFTSIEEARESIEIGGECELYFNPTVEEYLMTYRELLTTIGADLFRMQLHPDIWINSTFSKYKPVQRELKLSYNKTVTIPQLPFWIITDVRYHNELNAISDRNGVIIRINRLYKVDETTTYRFNNIPEHESETVLDEYKEFDYTIDNTGSIEDLYNKVVLIVLDLHNKNLIKYNNE